MEIGEASRKELQLEVPWIPTTPIKPNLRTSVPICTIAEGTSLCCNSSKDCVVACCEPSPSADIRSSQQDQAVPATAATSNAAGDNVGTCELPSLDNLSNSKNVRFTHLLALADAASAHTNAKRPHNDEDKSPISATSDSQFKDDPVANPTGSLLSHHNLPTDHITNHANYDSPQEPQSTSYTVCGSKTISQFAPLTPDKVIRAKCRLVAGMQIIVEEKDQGEEENTVPSTNLDKNETPCNQEHSGLVIDLSFAAVSTPFGENQNLDKEGNHGNDQNRTPQQKPKRKKHRPKVITEGKPKRTRKPVTPKPPQSKENQTVKRKYVRRKGLNKTSSTTPTAMTRESTEPMMPESNKKSCRRPLNFHAGELPRDENSSCRENATIHLDLGKGTGVRDADLCVGFNYDPNLSTNQAPKDYMSLPEDTQPQSISPSNSNPPGAEQEAHSVKNNSKRKDQVTSLNEQPQSKENQTGKRCYVRRKGLNKTCKTPSTVVTGEFTEQIIPDKNSCRRSLNFHTIEQPRDENSSCRESGTIHLDLGKGTTVRDADMFVGHDYDINSSMNLALNDYMSLPEDTQAPSIPFSKSNLPGAKLNAYFLTDSRRNDLVTSLDGYQNNASVMYYSSSSKSGIQTTGLHTGGFKRKYSSTLEHANTGNFNPIGAHYNELPACQVKYGDQFPNVQKKRIKMGQISGTSIFDRQVFYDSKAPQTCIGPIIPEMHTSLTRKKRIAKKSILASSAYYSTNEMQLHYKFVLDKSSGAAHEVSWESLNTMDALIEQLRHLKINTDGRDLASQEKNALIPYNQKNQKNRALVPGSGTIIRWESAFEHIKKRRLRPKVELDEETNRVWQLLLLDINSQGVDGTDEDKAKWWEEERRVFRGRADSFIARMHLVQGDRRFSQWKGSVVDSVVGVFLTQNVSDHLSSSAFMSLAARFPLKSSSKGETCHEGLVISEQQVHIEEPEENTKYEHSSMTADIMEHSEDKAVNSDDCCRITSIAIREPDYSMLGEPNETTTGEGQEKSCSRGIRKELNDIVSSQSSVISSQISGDFSIDQNPGKVGSCSDSSSEVEDLPSTAKFNIHDNSTSFSKLLEIVNSTMLHEVHSQGSKSTDRSRDAYGQSIGMKHNNQTKNLEKSDVIHGSLEATIFRSCEQSSKLTRDSGIYGFAKNIDENDMNKSNIQTTEGEASITHSQSMSTQHHLQDQSNNMQQTLFNSCGQTQDLLQKARDLDSSDLNYAARIETQKRNAASVKPKNGRLGKKEKDNFNWDNLRKRAQAKKGIGERTANTMDSLDWDAVRCADVNEIAKAIKDRGMNNVLAERIKSFLNRLVEDHGGIDLEWLREVPPDQAKEYLLSIRGLGLKSVECVRLLTLHHLAFPVDTNVGRIAVRLGWVPLQPLPESLQLHLLEMYPLLESIQKYLWPRLCKLEQKTLYELHYQMITFGKVFCTKSKPNCNACPMRGECRHFASAFASARLALPGPEQNSIISTAGNNLTNQNPSIIANQLPWPLPLHTNQAEEIQQTEVSRQLEAKSEINICQPIIEEPATPEPECTQVANYDIEDAFYEDPCEIPTIKLNFEEFTLNVQSYVQENMELQAGEMSKALVALTPEAASIPAPKLKNVSQLRTEHCVYELPDSHPLLQGWDKREPDDPCKYLLAIWTPGETESSIQPPEHKCSSQECGQLCNKKECFPCNSIREANLQIVRGTFLIPCRTAMRGSFPLNGTYFQVNEVFADHDSSLNPINVPRSWIWNLNRKTVYFGTSIPSIFKGLSTPEIQQCFWRGYVCVRGFDRERRAPRPLMARLHFPASRLAKTKESMTDNK